MRKSRVRLGALAGVACCAMAVSARAQMVAPAPVRQSGDANGVDLFLGTLNVSSPKISMGSGEQGLSYFFANTGSGWTDNVTAALDQSGSVATVRIGASTDDFTVSGSSYISRQARGATLVKSGTVYTYTAPDGTIAHFATSRANSYPYYASLGRATDVISPSGAKLVYNYGQASYCSKSKELANGPVCTQHTIAYRLTSIASTYGYALTFGYAADTVEDDGQAMEGGLGPWSTVSGMALQNLQRGGDTYSLHSSSSSGAFTVSSAEGLTSYRMDGVKVLGITRPDSASENVSYGYNGNRVSSVTTVAGTWSYAANDSGGQRNVTVTDPSQAATNYVFDIASARMTSMTDALNHTSAWQYDGAGRLTRATAPEGNSVEYVRDGRGNVTTTMTHAKPGTGQPDITTSAGYDGVCGNVRTCNQPSWTRDARGNQTDYSYDATHGGIISVTLPAAPNGVRPQVRTGYTDFSDQFGGKVYLPTSSSACRTQASCAGSADEVVTETSYGSLSGNNLLPVSVTRRAGDNSVSSATSVIYDPTGNVLYATDPLGAQSQFQYDGARRQTLAEGPDPDGNGPLQFRAVRTTYNGDNTVARVEVGTANQWGTGFTSLQRVESSYDSAGRKLSETTKSGATIYSWVDYGYDAATRRMCVALRMNLGALGSAPNACSPGTQGGDGPDRLTLTQFDALGRTQDVTAANGTPDASTEHMGYTLNGQTASVTDANNNVTAYGYDAYDRLSTTTYPGGSYEQLGYDAAGNVTSRRLRDGQVVGYGYDALGRAVSRDRPGTEADTSYGYDLLGHLTGASDTAGRNLVFGYDALGRLVSNGQALGTMSSRYDAAGRRTRLTWPDGRYVVYEYDAAGEMTAIRNDDAGSTLLASYGYDDLGRRTGMTRGNGTTTAYGYDPASRLVSLEHDIAGTGFDQVYGFTYNAAGQIASRTGSNDAFAWGGAVNADRGYRVNGLNQYTGAGSVAFAYDGRGNLTSSGTDGFAYDSDNALTGMHLGTTDTTVGSDPLGRIDQYGSINPYVGSVVTTRLLRDADGSVVGRRLEGAGRVTQLERFVPGPGVDEHAVWFYPEYAAAPIYFHADERGSVVALSGANGSGNGINRYDEAGIPDAANGIPSGPFGYTGQYNLGSGLYDYKARVYSPTLGRFLQTDPIGYGDGLNWYNYVGSDPVNATDPSGTWADVVVNGNPCSLGIGCTSIRGYENIRNILDSLAGLPRLNGNDDPDEEDVVVVGVRKKAKKAPTPGQLLPQKEEAKPCPAGSFMTGTDAAGNSICAASPPPKAPSQQKWCTYGSFQETTGNAEGVTAIILSGTQTPVGKLLGGIIGAVSAKDKLVGKAIQAWNGCK